MGDALGDRMKQYEGMETERASMPRLPIVVRIDGKGFSNWTAGLGLPFDERLQQLRVEVTRKLVEEFGATIGYCQSDEISLVLLSPREKSRPYCGGKFQKIVSHTASAATAFWNSMVPLYLPEKIGVPAMFDSRAWCVPDLEEAANALLWRERDATKNSVCAAARALYKHDDILGQSLAKMQDMLFRKGVNWNDYPDWAKRGTYLGWKTSSDSISGAERRAVRVLNLPPAGKIENLPEVLFSGAEPLLKQ